MKYTEPETDVIVANDPTTKHAVRVFTAYFSTVPILSCEIEVEATDCTYHNYISLLLTTQ